MSFSQGLCAILYKSFLSPEKTAFFGILTVEGRISNFLSLVN